MKKNEFIPDAKSTAFFQNESTLNEAHENKVFQEILPIIFHKLKNKLTPILGYAQILQSKTSDTFSSERLRKIEANAVELTNMLNILKDYGKNETTVMAPGNINHILQNLRSHFQKISVAEKIAINLNLDPTVSDSLLNAGQINVLLLHMVNNAVTALKMKPCPQKEIELSTRRGRGSFKLIIRDNGVGMDNDELSKIWAPFYAKYPDRAGLGLVICEKIIGNHLGECCVRSKPGEFTEFEIIFPVQTEPKPEPQNLQERKFKKVC